MTAVLWVLVGVLMAAVLFLVFALNGATRTVADLRRTLDVQHNEDDVPRFSVGAPVGSVAPPIDGVAFEGVRHLVVFAGPGCSGCEALVPPLLAWEGGIPIVLVGRDEVGWPDGWRSPATVVFDPDERIGDAFDVDFTPHVFVIDERGAIAAQGQVDTVEKVARMVREAASITIVGSEGMA